MGASCSRISLPALWLRRERQLRLSHLMTFVIAWSNMKLDVAIVAGTIGGDGGVRRWSAGNRIETLARRRSARQMRGAFEAAS